MIQRQVKNAPRENWVLSMKVTKMLSEFQSLSKCWARCTDALMHVIDNCKESYIKPWTYVMHSLWLLSNYQDKVKR